MKENVFLEKLELAFQQASANDYLVTLGITPTRPDTGYGYIQFVDKKDSDYYKVKTFTEKPILELAKSFLESGDFLWNAGIFIWNVKSIFSAFETHLPEMTQHFTACEYNAESEKAVSSLFILKFKRFLLITEFLRKRKTFT